MMPWSTSERDAAIRSQEQKKADLNKRREELSSQMEALEQDHTRQELEGFEWRRKWHAPVVEGYVDKKKELESINKQENDLTRLIGHYYDRPTQEGKAQEMQDRADKREASKFERIDEKREASQDRVALKKRIEKVDDSTMDGAEQKGQLIKEYRDRGGGDYGSGVGQEDTERYFQPTVEFAETKVVPTVEQESRLVEQENKLKAKHLQDDIKKEQYRITEEVLEKHMPGKDVTVTTGKEPPYKEGVVLIADKPLKDADFLSKAATARDKPKPSDVSVTFKASSPFILMPEVSASRRLDRHIDSMSRKEDALFEQASREMASTQDSIKVQKIPGTNIPVITEVNPRNLFSFAPAAAYTSSGIAIGAVRGEAESLRNDPKRYAIEQAVIFGTGVAVGAAVKSLGFLTKLEGPVGRAITKGASTAKSKIGGIVKGYAEAGVVIAERTPVKPIVKVGRGVAGALEGYPSAAVEVAKRFGQPVTSTVVEVGQEIRKVGVSNAFGTFVGTGMGAAYAVDVKNRVSEIDSIRDVGPVVGGIGRELAVFSGGAMYGPAIIKATGRTTMAAGKKTVEVGDKIIDVTSEMMIDKTASFRRTRGVQTPRKTLKERKPIGKVQQRKMTLSQSYDPRITFSGSEVIGRVRSPELKGQLTKERAIRINPLSKEITQVKDIGITRDPVTGSRSILKTDMTSGLSMKGQASTPRYSKLYPSDYGFLKDTPTGFKDVITAKHGQKVIQILQTKTGKLELFKRSPLTKQTPFNQQVLVEPKPVTGEGPLSVVPEKRVPLYKESPKGGFRKGQREKIFERLRKKKEALDFTRQTEIPEMSYALDKVYGGGSSMSTMRGMAEAPALGESRFSSLFGRKKKKPVLLEDFEYVPRTRGKDFGVIEFEPINVNGQIVWIKKSRANIIISEQGMRSTTGIDMLKAERRGIGIQKATRVIPEFATRLTPKTKVSAGQSFVLGLSAIQNSGSVLGTENLSVLDVKAAQRETQTLRSGTRALSDMMVDTAVIARQEAVQATQQKQVLATTFGSLVTQKITTPKPEGSFFPDETQDFEPRRPEKPKPFRTPPPPPPPPPPRPHHTPPPPPPTFLPFLQAIKGKKPRTAPFNVESAYIAEIKRRGEYKKASRVTSRSDALDVGARKTVDTLAASFRVRRVPGVPKDIKTSGEFSRYRNRFRDYRVSKGRQVPLPEDTYIQHRRTRLGTKTEVSEIQRAKNLAPQKRSKRPKRRLSIL